MATREHERLRINRPEGPSEACPLPGNKERREREGTAHRKQTVLMWSKEQRMLDGRGRLLWWACASCEGKARRDMGMRGGYKLGKQLLGLCFFT